MGGLPQGAQIASNRVAENCFPIWTLQTGRPHREQVFLLRCGDGEIFAVIYTNRFLLTGLAVVVLAAAGITFRARQTTQTVAGDGYVGSSSCRSCHEKAATLRPDFAPPLVNAAVIYSQLGDMPKAEAALGRAIVADPKEPAAHFNLGLLLAEMGHHDEATKELRIVLQLDASNAAAAYDLAVLVGNKSLAEALALCKKATALDRENPKYRNAVAFFQERVAAVATMKAEPVHAER